MKYRLLLISSLLFLGAAPVYVLRFQDTVNPFSSRYILRGLQEARERDARLVVLIVDTPGGLLTSTKEIVSALLASPVPVASFVYPSGAGAISAGAFIVLAADVAAMAPGTTIGASAPVAIGAVQEQEKQPPVPELPGTNIMKKLEELAASMMRSIAQERNRNLEAAEAMVREAKSYTVEEALELGLVDLIAQDLQDLLEKLEGREIVRGEQRIRLEGLRSAPRVEVPMHPVERFLSYFANPTMVYILYILTVSALLVGISNLDQYWIIVVGLVLLLLFLVVAQALPINYGAAALVALGILLMVLEAKLPTNGVLGAIGFAAFVVGSSMFAGSKMEPTFRVPYSVIALFGVPLVLFVILAVYLIARGMMRRPITGAESLHGERALVVKDLAPEGLVELQGEIWRARSLQGTVPKDAWVRVVKKEGLLVFVEPEKREGSENE